MSRLSGALARVAASEVVAMTRVGLAPLNRFHPLPAPSPRSGWRPVVLVHGFLGHPSMMRPLARRLLEEGAPEVVLLGYPSLRLSLEGIVDRISATVKPLTVDGPVHLVGHSLGAVAARAYTKQMGGHEHVGQFVSLGGPHRGTSLYRFVPPWLRPALSPRGRWPELLNEGPERVPTTIIRAAYDHQVFPPERAHLPGVTEVVLQDYGHNGILLAPEAHDAVIQALQP